ncbi:Glucose-induced degradation protein 4-like protein [Smittium culicis]|uniref:Glucose-induced degradation protein 4-like protein n=1 Tax=Smittium culicis TaxID=133412 RepID=A0A1R1YS15_9FUNG|nr:Glucose-induced degradation protein 4-like protein [Smittium culicis]
MPTTFKEELSTIFEAVDEHAKTSNQQQQSYVGKNKELFDVQNSIYKNRVLGKTSHRYFRKCLKSKSLNSSNLSGSSYSNLTELRNSTTEETKSGSKKLLVSPEYKIMFNNKRLIPVSYHMLYSGSKFKGFQTSEFKSYPVSITLKYVDIMRGSLCGYFCINNLLNDNSSLMTYFETEIIGINNSTFVTNKWDASVAVDAQHWGLFDQFDKYKHMLTCQHSSGTPENSCTATTASVSANDFDFMSCDVVFMRVKELFLVPDHTISQINGASFAGFYYMCYDPADSCITGYYYHRESEKFQKIVLNHCPDNTFMSFELS